ncbi:MAG: P-loop NTPase fold protein [Candidatus Kapaibacterium sp.]
MSFSHARAAIKRFLTKTEPRVLAVRGDWGVGKTFLWRKIIEDQSSHYYLKKYAYISLFGIESINDLKEQIFQKTISMENTAVNPSVESATKNFADMFQSAKRTTKKSWFLLRKSSGYSKEILQFIPYLSKSANLLTSLSTLAVGKTLICLDDMERKGKGMRTEDIFGLISELKEARNCSIVILLNEDAFSEEIGKGYADFRDKVIDMEITLSPEPRECVELVIPEESQYRNSIATYVERLHITNMRVIKRCADILNDLDSILKGREDAVIEETIKSIILFSWCWFHRRDGVPKLEDVIAAGKSPYISLFKEPKDLSPDEMRLREVMISYDYSSNSVIDEPLAEYVRHGYYDNNLLKKAYDQRDVEAQSKQAGSIFASISGNLLWGEFGDNSNDIARAFRKMTEDHGKNYSGYDLESMVQILRKIGNNRDADQLVDIYIEINRNRPGLFNVSLYDPDLSPSDPYILLKFSEAYIMPADTRPVFEVALKISTTHCSRQDVELMARQSSDDWYRIFHETKHNDLFRMANWLLKQGNVQGGPAEWKNISDNVLSALNYHRLKPVGCMNVFR